MTVTRRGVFIVFSCLSLAGCFQVGPNRLAEDQLGFSQALLESDKRQTLLNIVRLRYGDMPTFLDTTQVISGYQLQRSVTGGFEVFPSAPLSTYLSGTGAAQLQQSPTFTFQPVTGEHFAQSFLRPLSLSDLLPFVQGGLPVDVLFRLAVQSVGPLQNAMAQTTEASGSPGFFALIHALRRLQEAGLLSVRIDQESPTISDGKTVSGAQHVILTIAASRNAAQAADAAAVRRLLGLPADLADVEMIYGRTPRAPAQAAILTLSMMGVLGHLAFQIEVPGSSVREGRTLASVQLTDNERRPTIVVHASSTRPEGAFSAVDYRGTWFWIGDDDFDSKVAFTILNVLLALAKTSSSPNTVITIPAG